MDAIVQNQLERGRVESVKYNGSKLEGYNVIDLVYHAISVARQQESLMRQRPCGEKKGKHESSQRLLDVETRTPLVLATAGWSGVHAAPSKEKKQGSKRARKLHQCVGTMCCPVQSFVQSSQWGSSSIIIIYVPSMILSSSSFPWSSWIANHSLQETEAWAILNVIGDTDTRLIEISPTAVIEELDLLFDR